MKRHDNDAAQRLLEEYLEHVERWRTETSPIEQPVSVVVFDVLRYRRHVPRAVEPDARPARLS